MVGCSRINIHGVDDLKWQDGAFNSLLLCTTEALGVPDSELVFTVQEDVPFAP